MSGCEKYAEMMNRYLDGDLPAAQISDLLDHLETCASCRNRFDALKIVAFEMRHMQVDPPKALHGRVMQAVSYSGQRRPKAYLKTFAAVAACAAALVLAINGSFFQMADNYLFNSGRKDAPAESEQKMEDTDGAYNNTPAPASVPESAPEEQADDGEAMAPTPYMADEMKPMEPEEAEQPASADLPDEAALMPQNEEGGENKAQKNNQEPSYDQAEADTSSSPAADMPDSGSGQQGQASLPKVSQGARIAEAKNEPEPEPEPDPDQPLRIPALDTDEVFAFYCIAMGEGSIPNAFDKNEIVRFPDKNCMYIYVKTTQFTKKGCENLLSQSGFTIREGANLPDTDESMPYGLIVIYGTEMTQ